MKTRFTYLLFAFLMLGTITSCSVDSVDDQNSFPTYGTGDEVDETADPDEDDDEF